MKFRIHLTANSAGIPFNYTHKLCGIFHQWLGPNELHDMMSLYSLGWLSSRAKAEKGALWFKDGAHWDIGIHDDEIAERLVRGLLLKDFEFYGMSIRKVQKLAPPDFTEGKHRFLTNSPVMLRRTEDDRSKTFVLFDRPEESQTMLTRIWQHKLREAGKESIADSVSARFDNDFRRPKTRLIDVKGIKNKGSVCPIIAEGPSEALEFLWETGAGELTGTGFGSLDHTGKLRNGS